MTDNDPRRPDAGGELFARYREAASERRVPRRPLLPLAVSFVCALLVAAGAIGPWAYRRRGLNRPLETLDGFLLDGPLALVGALVAVVALLLVGVRPALGGAAWAAVAGLAFAAVVGAANWLTLDTAAPGYLGQTRGASQTIGWGLIVVVAAGALGVAAAVVVARRLD